MLNSISSLYNANQTRILLFATCFALITNIATIMVLFEQLEHEALCDQQNDFNDFVEAKPLQNIKSQLQQPKSNEIIIPKPNKLSHPPKPNKKSTNTIETIPINEQQLKPKSLQTKSIHNESEKISAYSMWGILAARGGQYEIYEFEPSEIKSTDWRYYLDYNIPKISYNSKQCNAKNFASSIFMNALRKLLHMREYGWFIQYDCPSYLQTEYRPIDLIPHIYQTQCAPFWPSDIIYLLSEILMPNMLGIEYGFSLSNIWIANFIDRLNIVDNRREKIDEYKEYLKQNKHDMSNIDMEYQRMSRNYVQRIDPSKGRIVDLAIIEFVPEYHDDVIKYVINMLKENNGILIMKLFDDNIPDDINELIDEFIPKYWLRYDSHIPKFLVGSVPFSQEQYLEESDMSIWITRTENDPCEILDDT